MDGTHQSTAPLWADQAEGILRSDGSLTDERRSTLWELFHDSASPADLARRLQYYDISNATKHKLFEAKRRTAPATSPVERTVSALRRVASIAPHILQVAEKHPTVLKAITDAAHVGTSHKTKSK